MYLEKIEGVTYLTIDKKHAMKQVEKLVNGTLSWIVAGVIAVGAFAAIYYGSMAYQYLTNLF